MSTLGANKPINGYIELASPQLLEDKWQELTFDLASGRNVLQDLVAPEFGGGYVYRDAKIVGSATQNRFIYWRTSNDILELIEISTEVLLENNQVRIKFANSPIVNDIIVLEFSDSVVIMVATLSSVHRLYLPHPRTTNKSILNELSNEILFNSSNYYILSNYSALNSQQPICATAWADETLLKCALSFPDSSLLIVQFGRYTHHVSTCDIKQTGIIGRIWSRMPNLLTRNQNDCVNSVFICAPYFVPETDDHLLFTLCKDWKIRVFSVTTRECVLTHSIIPQDSFSQSFASHTNPTTEQPMMKILGSHIVIYLTETRPEFVVFDYSFRDGQHSLDERFTVQTPNWEKLIDFRLSDHKIWALSNIRETETTLCYLNLMDVIEEDETEGSGLQGVWNFVNLVEDLDMPSSKNYVAEIFWRNRFSVATIQKALIGIAGPNIPREATVESLEEFAFTKIVDPDQEEAWARFYNYCLQNHQNSNKSIGLVVSEDESVISIVKRSNPSFVTPWLMNVDMVLECGLDRGIEFPISARVIIEPLNYISTELMDDDLSSRFEHKLFENPANCPSLIDEIMHSLLQSKRIPPAKFNSRHKNLLSSIDFLCEQLDLTSKAESYGSSIVKGLSTRMRSEHNPLESNCGIAITYKLFKRLVRARMILARDLLIYIQLITKFSETEKIGSSEKPLIEFCEELYTSSRIRRIMDSLRSYAALVWMTESPVRLQSPSCNSKVIDMLSSKFEYFKKASKRPDHCSSLDMVLHRNLFMNFLMNGGVQYSSPMRSITEEFQTISSSSYVIEIATNLCLLLWPKTEHLCLPEFLITNQLDEHLDQYLDLTKDWLNPGENNRYFIKAFNCLLQNRLMNAVEIFNRIWMHINPSNLLGLFIELDKEEIEPDENLPVTPTLIYRYYDKLVQLFQIFNDRQCLIILINHCMSLIDEEASKDQQHWVNCFRAKLFQYHLELDEPEEAYHTMVLTTDSSLRVNCLRRFIVHHCETEQWSNMLTYPYIGIKDDFIDILNQKADSSDLSKLSVSDFHKTTYYDILFASYVSGDKFQQAASIMYSYAQRLAHEVPGILSIRKQADCLLIALTSIKCVDKNERFFEFGNGCPKEDGRISVLKRAYDCSTIKSPEEEKQVASTTAKVWCIDIEMKHQLTSARLKLLEKDQTANAIALSPLTPAETISQLVASSMFETAVDLALSFRVPMEPILEGLTAKFIFLSQLSSLDIAAQELELGLSDIFSISYSNMDTYNYIANSTSSYVDKLWRLIDYYLTSYDGISHQYSSNAFSKSFTGSTVLMKVVATKLLSTGYDVPASLKRMYMSRNTSELLRLLIKYDKLVDAADLAIEMIDITLEPSMSFSFSTTSASSDPPPVYLPTHLILQLLEFLNEDATNTIHLKTSDALTERLNRFRRFVAA